MELSDLVAHVREAEMLERDMVGVGMVGEASHGQSYSHSQGITTEEISLLLQRREAMGHERGWGDGHRDALELARRREAFEAGRWVSSALHFMAGHADVVIEQVGKAAAAARAAQVAAGKPRVDARKKAADAALAEAQAAERMLSELVRDMRALGQSAAMEGIRT